MSVRAALIAVTSLMLALALFQTLPVSPHAGDMHGLFRSGYFRELDRQFAVISEGFIALKTMSKPVYAWVFLEDIGSRHGIRVRVHDLKGKVIVSPGSRDGAVDDEVARAVSLGSSDAVSSVRGDTYRLIMPLATEKRCRICHHRAGSLTGVLVFEKKFDSHVYYTGERVIIFLALAVFLLVLLILIIRWNPAGPVNKLFDK